jgi:phosphoglycerol transferase
MNWRKTLPLVWIVFFVSAGIWGGFFRFAPDTYGQMQRPIEFRGDVLVGYEMAKSMAQGEWYPWQVPQNQFLGYPGGHSLHDYPVNERVGFTIVWLLSLVTKNPFLIFNGFFFLGFFLCAFSFYWLLRKYRVRSALAVLGSLFFTFLPYHHLRLQHLFLANYFLVPVMIYLSFRSLTPAKGKLFQLSFKSAFKKLWPYAGLMLLFANTNIYYCLFFVFMLAAHLLFHWEKVWQNWRLVLFPAFLSGVLVLGILISFLPHLSFQWQNGPNPAAVKRHSSESEVYALKPSSLLLPAEQHRIPWLAALKAKYVPAIRAEGHSESMGLMGLSGLMLIFFLSLKKRASNTFSILTKHLLGLFALGITGGLGALLSTYVLVQFRAFNRVSVFIAAICFLGIFVFLNKVVKKQKQILALGVFVLFLVDGFPKSMRVQRDHSFAYLEDKQFFAQLDGELSDGGKILQLPYMEFPETPTLNDLWDYDHLKPYLVSEKSLYFSYGSMKGRPGAAAVAMLSTMPLLPVTQLVEKGFSAVLVDLHGFKAETRQSELDRLAIHLNAKPTIGGWAQRLAFFSLKGDRK